MIGTLFVNIKRYKLMEEKIKEYEKVLKKYSHNDITDTTSSNNLAKDILDKMKKKTKKVEKDIEIEYDKERGLPGGWN